MYHLDIPKTRQYDTGKVEVIARSSVGEALATTDLKVIQRKDDYRGVLKNSPRRKFLPLQIDIFAQKILTNITPINRLHEVNKKIFLTHYQSTSSLKKYNYSYFQSIFQHFNRINLTQDIASCKKQTNKNTCPLSKYLPISSIHSQNKFSLMLMPN